jgi:hypothetical protein
MIGSMAGGMDAHGQARHRLVAFLNRFSGL